MPAELRFLGSVVSTALMTVNARDVEIQRQVQLEGMAEHVEPKQASLGRAGADQNLGEAVAIQVRRADLHAATVGRFEDHFVGKQGGKRNPAVGQP